VLVVVVGLVVVLVVVVVDEGVVVVVAEVVVAEVVVVVVVVLVVADVLVVAVVVVVVIAGLTVSLAVLLSVSPCAFASTARTSSPDSAAFVGSIRSFVVVAPEMVAPVMAVQLVPPLVDTCHWIVAAEQLGGTLPSVTLNVASPGAVTVASSGPSPITGEEAHVRVG